MKFKCPLCTKKWKEGQESIQCSTCNQWVHHNNKNNCSLLTNKDFNSHSDNVNLSWNCAKCDAETFPFNDMNENDFFLSNFSGNDTVSDDVNLVPNRDLLKFPVECDKITSHFDNDEDPNLPQIIDSNYCDINEFNSIKIDKPSSFGIIHMNIASMNKHIDDLSLILSLLTHKIDVIGISEHKIQKSSVKSSANIKIPGYHEFVFRPTETSHGGAGFYLKDYINYVERTDLDFSSVGDFETSFIEIKFPKKKNLVIGCIYRHPTSIIPIQDVNATIY